jgi:enoyl-CoA hydratase
MTEPLMSWEITEKLGVAIVWMQSNKVNKQNPNFFSDLELTLDRLEREFPNHPVVITSKCPVFSAGFDFDYWFPSIAQGLREKVQSDYDRFKQINLRLFTYPRPTVAAINGHAYAGGLITALCCDFRVIANDDINLTLNEVPIGLGMPSLFTEIIRYALGTPLAAKATLTGRIYRPAEALSLGMVDSIVEPETLIDGALYLANCVVSDCLDAYSFSKRALQAPTIKRIVEETAILDDGFGAAWCSSGAKTATMRTHRELKSRVTV